LTFRAYFENGIKLKAAIRNCKNFKIEKLIFIDEMTNEYMDFTIDELEQMDLT
jgi:sRNA-binding regulator protein Hfq